MQHRERSKPRGFLSCCKAIVCDLNRVPYHLCSLCIGFVLSTCLAWTISSQWLQIAGEVSSVKYGMYGIVGYRSETFVSAVPPQMGLVNNISGHVRPYKNAAEASGFLGAQETLSSLFNVRAFLGCKLLTSKTRTSPQQYWMFVSYWIPVLLVILPSLSFLVIRRRWSKELAFADKEVY